MKLVKYFFEYILIIILFILFKLVGYRIASELGCFLGKTFGPFFRSKEIIKDNLNKFDSTLTPEKLNDISEEMWGNYGRILSEYPYISNFILFFVFMIFFSFWCVLLFFLFMNFLFFFFN